LDIHLPRLPRVRGTSLAQDREDLLGPQEGTLGPSGRLVLNFGATTSLRLSKGGRGIGASSSLELEKMELPQALLLALRT